MAISGYFVVFLQCSVYVAAPGGETPILDLTWMVIVTLIIIGVEIAVLVTLRVSQEENGENGNF